MRIQFKLKRLFPFIIIEVNVIINKFDMGNYGKSYNFLTIQTGRYIRLRRWSMGRFAKVIGCCTLFVGVCALTVFAALYDRAPDVNPGTLPEMRTTAYWIALMENPDEVVLTPQAIEKMNRAYELKAKSANPFEGVAQERKARIGSRWSSRVINAPDLLSMSPTALADTVKKVISTKVASLRRGTYGNVAALPYAEREIQAFEDEMALDKVSDQVSLTHGIMVRDSRIRNVPSFLPEQPGITGNGKGRWDMWNIGIVPVCSPVTILHQSLSGEYLLVFCNLKYGWVLAQDVAFATDRQIEEYANPKDFVVCTGDRVQYYADPDCVYSTGWFRMGDRLPLASKSGTNQVKIPFRNFDGQLMPGIAYLRPGSDYNKGFLPYTRRNIVETAFKLLDDPYDWTGGWWGRSHETIYPDIFAVFGFRLPWHGGLFTLFGNNENFTTPKMTEAEQFSIILRNEPFVTLQSCGGHVQLLLGEYNDVPIVFDNHGYSYEDEDGKTLEIRRVNIGIQRLPNYFLRRNVTFLTLN